MARTMIPWRYTADDGNTYRKLVAVDIASQKDGLDTKIGGVPATADDAKWPSYLKPRVAIVFDAATGKRRRVVCFDTVAPLWTDAVAAIDLHSGAGGAAVSHAKYNTEGERSRAYAPKVLP